MNKLPIHGKLLRKCLKSSVVTSDEIFKAKRGNFKANKYKWIKPFGTGRLYSFFYLVKHINFIAICLMSNWVMRKYMEFASTDKKESQTFFYYSSKIKQSHFRYCLQIILALLLIRQKSDFSDGFYGVVKL